MYKFKNESLILNIFLIFLGLNNNEQYFILFYNMKNYFNIYSFCNWDKYIAVWAQKVNIFGLMFSFDSSLVHWASFLKWIGQQFSNF